MNKEDEIVTSETDKSFLMEGVLMKINETIHTIQTLSFVL